MEIKKIENNKKEFLELLLLGDEQEDMIDRYLYRGDMFVLSDNGIKAECVVTKEAETIYEIKNIAVVPEHQNKGYGKTLIDFVFSYYPDCLTLLAGTGDSPATLGFYLRCGFTESHRVENFFTDNYFHPIFEGGKILKDMVYMKKHRL